MDTLSESPMRSLVRRWRENAGRLILLKYAANELEATIEESAVPSRPAQERWKRFNDETGSLTGGNQHPDRCVCQERETGQFAGTPHKHYGESPHSCARCGCRAYRPMLPAPPADRPEICICAAIRMDSGVILRGHRHDDCFRTAHNYGYTERITQAKQGFVTSRNRFVDREEGARLQQQAGIVSAHTGTFTDYLLSEDLYFNDTAAIDNDGAVR